VAAYARGIASRAFLDGPRVTRLDRVLVTFAVRGPFRAGLADAYGRFLAPAGQLRRRLVLLMAVLESTSPGFHAFEPPAAGRVAAFAGVMADAAGFAFRLLLALPVVGGLHVLSLARSGSAPESQSNISS
jgi:hypothetical protein